MTSETILRLCSLTVVSTVCLAKNVVLLPPPMSSYIIYHANIGQALTELGHNVSLCVPEYLSNKELVPHKSINIIRYGEYLGDVQAKVLQRVDLRDQFWQGKPQTFLSRFPLIQMFKELINEILSDTKFLAAIQEHNPEFFVVDNFMYIRNILVLPYKMGIPFSLIGSFPDNFLNGIPFNPASEPLVIEYASYNKTFFERVKAVTMSLIFLSYDLFSDADVVSRYAPEKAYMTIRDIALKAEIFIAETDHVLDYPRTSLPNTKLIGGSSVSEAKPLSGEVKRFVEMSSRGVAVVSFGGYNIYIPDHIRSKMATAFQKLNLNVIWKINWTFEQRDKILTLNWIPQNDLLGHPKTRVLVSHCGKNSQYEALYHGVPILCLPMLSDQFYNSKRIFVKGFGQYADIREITSDELARLIQQVADDPKYRSNIQQASTIFRELYKIPSKEAAFWLDHAMKYGGNYMRSSGQQMPLYQFLLLDVMAFLLFILIVTMFILFVIVKLCCYRFRTLKMKND
ncbi:2-hydroxyacylsphingosine 1-beta-galactosyltransferase [Biomphalaria glabrata]|nr:2-hydroxyacylsphingosine 1-beta-galactosyltransferase-like [Biomphalaria glabrata]